MQDPQRPITRSEQKDEDQMDQTDVRLPERGSTFMLLITNRGQYNSGCSHKSEQTNIRDE